MTSTSRVPDGTDTGELQKRDGGPQQEAPPGVQIDDKPPHQPPPEGIVTATDVGGNWVEPDGAMVHGKSGEPAVPNRGAPAGAPAAPLGGKESQVAEGQRELDSSQPDTPHFDLYMQDTLRLASMPLPSAPEPPPVANTLGRKRVLGLARASSAPSMPLGGTPGAETGQVVAVARAISDGTNRRRAAAPRSTFPSVPATVATGDGMAPFGSGTAANSASVGNGEPVSARLEPTDSVPIPIPAPAPLDAADAWAQAAELAEGARLGLEEARQDLRDARARVTELESIREMHVHKRAEAVGRGAVGRARLEGDRVAAIDALATASRRRADRSQVRAREREEELGRRRADLESLAEALTRAVSDGTEWAKASQVSRRGQLA